MQNSSPDSHTVAAKHRLNSRPVQFSSASVGKVPASYANEGHWLRGHAPPASSGFRLLSITSTSTGRNLPRAHLNWVSSQWNFIQLNFFRHLTLMILNISLQFVPKLPVVLHFVTSCFRILNISLQFVPKLPVLHFVTSCFRILNISLQFVPKLPVVSVKKLPQAFKVCQQGRVRKY
jgi:hypothetical protein